MMKLIARMFMVLVLVGAAGIALAGGARENAPFVSRLETELQKNNFSEEEAAAIAAAARDYDWSNAEDADPALIARALRRVEEDGEDGEELTTLEQAQLALQLALTATEMHDKGYDETTVARATLQSVHTLVSQIRSWKENGKQGNLGEIVRGTVSSEVEAEARKRGDAVQPDTPAGKKAPEGVPAPQGDRP